jgi:hypothetical protein
LSVFCSPPTIKIPGYASDCRANELPEVDEQVNMSLPNYAGHQLPVWLQRQLYQSIAKHLEKCTCVSYVTE